jgi:hypothetical protein
MFAAAREEAAIITTEIASSARSGALEAMRGAEAEVLNPLQIRQVAEASVKEAVGGEYPVLCSPSLLLHITEALFQPVLSGICELIVIRLGESSILSHHLSHLPKPSIPQPLEQSLPTNLSTGFIAKTLEKDLGVTFREALSNAAETGVEEQMDEVVVVAQALTKGGLGDPAKIERASEVLEAVKA